MAKKVKLKDYDPPITRPKTFDEVIDRLLALEKVHARRAGRPSDLRAQVNALFAIMREGGIITDEHESFLERYTGKKRPEPAADTPPE